jgi:ribonuclease HI
MSKYYAVKSGVIPGIYRDWDVAKLQVNGYNGAVHKSFKTEVEAINYMNQNVKDVKTQIEVKDVNVKNVNVKDVNVKNVNVKDVNVKNINVKKGICLLPKNIDILAYTDGSCRNKIGGYGLVILHQPFTNIIEDSGLVPYTPCTNQIAEIYAINRVLTSLLSHCHEKIMIRTDSEFCINCFTDWIKNWKKNGFILTTKKPVKNKQLIIDTDLLLQSFKYLTFEHVYSHEGEIYNEMVDKLAKKYT